MVTQLVVAPEFCEHRRPTYAAQVKQIEAAGETQWAATVVYKCKHACRHLEVTNSERIRIVAGGKPLPVYG